MPKEFRLPDLGSGLQEGQIVNWLVEVGQDVTTSDNLCEIETEKAVIEIPVPYSGKVLELKVEAGEMIDVGAVLAVFGTEGGADEAPTEEPVAVTAKTKPEPVKAAVTEPSEQDGGRIRAMPSIRRIAKEHGIDLASVDGSGRHGRITR